MFSITFNGAGPRPIKEGLGKTITEVRRRRRPTKEGKKKWVDDLTLTVPVRLQDSLVPDTRPDIARPVPYHSRTLGQATHCQNRATKCRLN